MRYQVTFTPRGDPPAAPFADLAGLRADRADLIAHNVLEAACDYAAEKIALELGVDVVGTVEPAGELAGVRTA